MNNRNMIDESYRYGFNKQEKDNEIKKSYGSSYDFNARLLDTRLGKWLIIDPLKSEFPYISSYAAYANNPLCYIDKDGKKIVPANKDTKKIIKEIYKNGTPEVRAKIDLLKKSDVKYNFNFFATESQITENTTGLSTGQTPLGVTNYDFSESSKQNKDVVNVFVSGGDLQGNDRKLVGINEIGGAYDFEVGNVGYAKQGDKQSPFAYDVGDEYDQAMDVIAYAEKNGISFPDKSGYIGLKNIRDNKGMSTRAEKLKYARLVFNNSFGYNFSEDVSSQKPEDAVKAVEDSPTAKGQNYVYRQNGKTVKGTIK